MRRAITFLLPLLLLTACQGTTIIEEWPETPPSQEEQQPVEEPSSDAIDSVSFTLVQGVPKQVSFENRTHEMILLGIINNRSRLSAGGTTFMLGINETVEALGDRWRLDEIGDAPVPKESLVDLSFEEERVRIGAGENETIGNTTISVEFIVEREGIPAAMVVVGGEEAMLTTSGERGYEQGYVHVHRVYYEGESSYERVPAIKVTRS